MVEVSRTSFPLTVAMLNRRLRRRCGGEFSVAAQFDEETVLVLASRSGVSMPSSRTCADPATLIVSPS
jgi:hypothetical protein